MMIADVGPEEHGEAAETAGLREWDPLLFAGAASFYEQGRLPYPPGLADAVAEASKLGEPGRLLDVGCGPGSVSLRCCDTFARVVGIDPDPDMIDEARRLASDRNIRNATFLRLRAEDLPAGLGQFDVAAFAASFRWVDRPRVVGIVRQMLTDTGVAITISGGSWRAQPAPDAPYPSPPWEAIGDLVRSFLGPRPRAGRGFRWDDPADFETVWAEAGFEGPEHISVPDGHVYERTVDDIVAFTFSQSSSVPHLFGSQLAAFRADLLSLLEAAGPDGRFALCMSPTPLNVWRKAG